MQCVRIGQDHKDSSTKSGRDSSRRETRDGLHRRDGTFQSGITATVPVLQCVCRRVHKILFVDLLEAKSEALASLKKFFLSVGTPKKMRQDNAKEFLSGQFKTYCLDAGILQEKTIPETPQQNGLAERCNRALLEMTGCLLFDSRLPKMIWGATILPATRIRNLVVRREEEKCPAELVLGIKHKLSISKLYTFGCKVLMRKKDTDVRKLEPKSLEGKFVCYTEGDNGYLVYIPNTRKVVAVRDVIIKESEVGSSRSPSLTTPRRPNY